MHRFHIHLITLACTAVLAAAHLPITHAARLAADVTLTSCTEDALRAAAATPETTGITFDCGAATTIVLRSPLDITKPALTIDGGGTITLSGGDSSQVIVHHTYGMIGSSVLTLKNMAITSGTASGSSDAANGGAIESFFEAANPAYKPTLNIEDVTFSSNNAAVTSFSQGDAYDYGGGAIYSRGGFVNISSSTFRDNNASNGAGGAIHILQSGLMIADSSFTNNTAIGRTTKDSVGGAIYIDGLGGENSRFSISGSTFEGNQAYNSGGAIHVNMYENSSSMTIDRSRFSNNAVVGGDRAQGGAIGGGGSNIGGNTGNPAITITRSLFEGNSAKKSGTPSDGSGGAVAFPQRAVIRIENSTFSTNRAEGSSYNANGGALYVVNNTTPFEIVSSTFANNFAGWVGGAISNSQIGDQPGGTLANTIFANNTAGGIAKFQQHCSSELAEVGANLQYPARQTDGNYYNDVTCFKGKSAPDQKGLPAFRDPKLQPLADNGGPTKTMAIDASSPAFDGGGASCPATDQRGTARPQGSACDIGAFELVERLAVSPSLVSQADPSFTLTVTGTGFTSASTIVIGGQQRPTTFVSSTTLTTRIAGSDFDTTGAVAVSVSGSTLPAAQITVVASLKRTFVPLVGRG